MLPPLSGARGSRDCETLYLITGETLPTPGMADLAVLIIKLAVVFKLKFMASQRLRFGSIFCCILEIQGVCHTVVAMNAWAPS
jgi:hypothetical protein